MTYPRLYNIDRSGFVLADVLVSLGLVAVFVSGITAMSIETQDIFGRSFTRKAMLDSYVHHQADFDGMMPGDEIEKTYTEASSSINAKARARWYGNDRIETDVSLHDSGQSMAFAAVRAYPYADIAEAAGAALCSPDLASGATVGSYSYLHPADVQGAAPTADITPMMLPVDPLLPLTGLAVKGNTVYITADSSVASDPDLLIVDITDKKRPRILSQIDTGPGLSGLSIAGKYVFAAAASTAAQLHVIRLDSLGAPALVKKYKLPLPTASTTAPMGSAIYYDRKIVYLGTEKWDGQELAAIDVSDPAAPRMVGGLEIGSKVNDIFVKGGTALIASASVEQMRTVDVSHPDRLVKVMSFSPSGSDRQEGNVVAMFEGSSALGRTSGGFDILADHEAFFWPSNASVASSTNISGGTYGIVIDRHHVYVATRDVGKELSVFSHTLATSTASYHSLPVAPQAMTCDGDGLFILAHTAPAIYEIKMYDR